MLFCHVSTQNGYAKTYYFPKPTANTGLGVAVSANTDTNADVNVATATSNNSPQIDVVDVTNNSNTNSTSDKCIRQSWQGVNPVIVNDGFKQDAMLLCFDEFTAYYSGISKTSLWVAEKLTSKRIQTAQQLKRVDRFHVEPLLPPEWQSQLKDYKDPIYDRGHLAPSGDMATADGQYQSFSLVNIAPQNSIHNRETWADIEKATRILASYYKEIYVVTGVIYTNKNVSMLNEVFIPTHFFKALYIPKANISSVYVSPNTTQKEVKLLSLKQLDTLAGIQVFSNLPTQIRAQSTWLPSNGSAALAFVRQQKRDSKNPFNPSNSRYAHRSTPSVDPAQLIQKGVQKLLSEIAVP